MVEPRGSLQMNSPRDCLPTSEEAETQRRFRRSPSTQSRAGLEIGVLSPLLRAYLEAQGPRMHPQAPDPHGKLLPAG